MGGASEGNSASVEIPLRLVRASLETGAAADAAGGSPSWIR